MYGVYLIHVAICICFMDGIDGQPLYEDKCHVDEMSRPCNEAYSNVCVKNNPCDNGASCGLTPGGYICKCPAGWQSDHCDEDINKCDGNPCKNGGTCNNNKVAFTCSCAVGWTGTFCEVESAARCPIGWDHHGNSCYLFSKDTQSWNNSSDSCASVGASLVAIESQTEQTFIQNRLRHEFASFMWWLGGNDQFVSTDQTWYWVQTEQKINSGYTDWHRKEPDNPGQQHCLAMRKDFNYQWCDDYCPELHAYICEMTLGDLDFIG